MTESAHGRQSTNKPLATNVWSFLVPCVLCFRASCPVTTDTHQLTTRALAMLGETGQGLLHTTKPTHQHSSHQQFPSHPATHSAHRTAGNPTTPHHTKSIHHVTSHHVTSHHITSHHITSHHITSHHITSHHITSHHITSHHITSHHVTSHHITSHHITSHHITSHHITSHHITSHHILSTPQLYSRAGCRVRSPRRQGPGTANRRCTNSVGCAHVPVPSTIPRDPAAPSTGRLGPGNGQRPSVEDG